MGLSHVKSSNMRIRAWMSLSMSREAGMALYSIPAKGKDGEGKRIRVGSERKRRMARENREAFFHCCQLLSSTLAATVEGRIPAR